MRYFVNIGDRTVEVELTGDAITVDGVPMKADLVQLPGTPMRHLLLDGCSYTLVAAEGEARGEWQIVIDGGTLALEVIDERTRAIRAMTARTGAAQGPKPLRAPMPGLVTRIQVEVSQAVKAGQGLVIMEAMKMENELKAAVAGTVSKILVQPGQAVEKGAVLMEFESA